MPEPAGAGTSRMETAAPECRPIPWKSREVWIVCSNWGGLDRPALAQD